MAWQGTGQLKGIVEEKKTEIFHFMGKRSKRPKMVLLSKHSRTPAFFFDEIAWLQVAWLQHASEHNCVYVMHVHRKKMACPYFFAPLKQPERVEKNAIVKDYLCSAVRLLKMAGVVLLQALKASISQKSTQLTILTQ